MAFQEYSLTEAKVNELFASEVKSPSDRGKILGMTGGRRIGPSPAENANKDEWERLGNSMNFEPWSVIPSKGKSDRFFMAVPRRIDG